MTNLTRILFTLLVLAANGLYADEPALPLSDGFMIDKPSGDSCTVAIDHQGIEIELFAQKPEPVEGVQTGTVDWFHHMPRIGADRLGGYTVQVSIYPSQNMQQKPIHVLTITLLDERGNKYGAVGANEFRTKSRMQMTKTLKQGKGETISAICDIGESHVELQAGG